MATEFKNAIVYPGCRGLFTLLDSSLIPQAYLANSLNISCADGTIAPFKMYSPFGNQLTTDDDVGRIISTFTAEKGTGTEIPLRVRDNDTNTILEWYNSVNSTWETLLAGLTTAKRMAFADFNTSSQDYTYMCNGTENYMEWKKAIGTVASNTATVITLNETAATAGFASGGGTIITKISGTYTEKTYTGTSGKTLTGLSGLPTLTANQGVAEAVDDSTHSAITKFDILHVADGRMWGAITTSPRLYYSEVGNATNWTASTNPDDPGYRDFIEGQGSITGLNSIQENIIVFKKDLVKLYKLDYPSSTTRVSIAKDLRRGDNVGAVNPDAIEKSGETIYYITEKGGIKSVALNQSQDGYKFEDVTERIRPTLEDGVFTSARLTFFEKHKRLLAAYKKDSDSSQNDRVVVVEITTDKNGNTFNAIGILDWMVYSWFKYSNDLYFGGSYEPNCFKAFDGYRKGGGDYPFIALATFRRERFGRDFLQKECRYIGIEGWILPGSTLNFELDYDASGTMAHLEASFNPSTETAYIIQPQLNTKGAFELGSEPIGGTLSDIDELNHFKMFLRLPHLHHPREIQLTVYSDLVGARWKINPPAFLVSDADYIVPKKLKKGFS